MAGSPSRTSPGRETRAWLPGHGEPSRARRRVPSPDRSRRHAPFRAQRIAERLERSDRITIEETARLQIDTVSITPPESSPRGSYASSPRPRTRRGRSSSSADGTATSRRTPSRRRSTTPGSPRSGPACSRGTRTSATGTSRGASRSCAPRCLGSSTTGFRRGLRCETSTSCFVPRSRPRCRGSKSI